MGLKHSNNGLSLCELPDDCLIRILRYLEVSDLADFGKCSPRCRTLSRTAFVLNYKGVLIFDKTVSDRAFRLFGDLITSISFAISGLEFNSNEATRKHLIRYFRGKIWLVRRYVPNLLKLEFGHYGTQLFQSSNWEVFVPKLRILKLGHVYSHLVGFNQLVILHVGHYCFSLDETLSDLNYPSIKYLYLHGYLENFEIFNVFAWRNTQLKGLALNIHGTNLPKTFMNVIKNFKHLEQLELAIRNSHDAELMNGLYNELAGMEPLRSFHMLYSPHYYDSIMNIKQLQVLCWTGPFDNEFWNDRLLDFAVNLPDLEELHVPLYNLKGVFRFIESAPKLKRLYLEKVESLITIDDYIKLVQSCKNRHCSIQIVRDGWPQRKFKDTYRKYSHIVSFVRRQWFDAVLPFPEHEVLKLED